MSVLRKCAVCGGSDFRTRGRCRPCEARIARERWRSDANDAHEKHRAKSKLWRAAKPHLERAANRRRRYGVTQEAFDAALQAQDGKCRICRAPDPNCVDHDHTTGRFRGVLCSPCNAGLGLLRDDPERIRAAIRYLERSAKQGVG